MLPKPKSKVTCTTTTDKPLSVFVHSDSLKLPVRRLNIALTNSMSNIKIEYNKDTAKQSSIASMKMATPQSRVSLIDRLGINITNQPSSKKSKPSALYFLSGASLDIRASLRKFAAVSPNQAPRPKNCMVGRMTSSNTRYLHDLVKKYAKNKPL